MQKHDIFFDIVISLARLFFVESSWNLVLQDVIEFNWQEAFDRTRLTLDFTLQSNCLDLS